jgi:hypothetical protein
MAARLAPMGVVEVPPLTVDTFAAVEARKREVQELD